MQNILIIRQSVRMMLLPIMPSVRKSVRVSVRISVISVGISVRVSDRPRQFKTKFWFSSGLLCFWDASGSFCMSLCETLLVSYEHIWTVQPNKPHGLLQCHACSGKSWTYKMTQGVTNAGWQKPGSIKWQCLTPCIHHKTRATAVATTLLWPLPGVPCWHYAALSFSSGLLCFWDAAAFFLHEPMWNPAGFIWIYIYIWTVQPE